MSRRDPAHKIGSSVQDLVTDGGSVLDGLSMQCASCKKPCMIIAPRGSFTSQEDLREELHCPYCGHKAPLKLSQFWGGRIIDTRPVGDDY